MNISVLSVFSQLYTPFLQTSLVRRAQEEGKVGISVDEFRSFIPAKERIDAPTMGHGAGMLIRPEVVESAIQTKEAVHGRAYRVFFSPHGTKLTQPLLKTIMQEAQKTGHLMLVAGRYEGMDARVEQTYADQIISVGDFVLMGGDVPAMMLLEGALRLIPGVVGRAESVEQDSFSGPFVDYPEYCHPVLWHDMEVPEVLRSGNHALIAAWRREQAVQRTVLGHFDWLRFQPLSPEEKKVTYNALPSHYMALMHTEVVVGDGDRVGTTSVTSLDIHDIARSCRTYGVRNYFLVTPLIDQQKIVRTLLDFWQEGAGIEYNASRHEAVKSVELVADLAAVKRMIAQKEGKEPVVIATSAREVPGVTRITYHDQGQVWALKRPVLLICGTGKGLSEELLRACDYVLAPIEGLMAYNHLSVRSAAAIILDRWLGLHVK